VTRKRVMFQPHKVERIFYTFEEAQEFLGVSHQTVYTLIRQRLPSHKIGRRRVFLKKDLIRWIKSTKLRGLVLCSAYSPAGECT